ncbi:alkaline phosphatase family protein [Pseudomonas mucidolens]|uniref:alkaline phosphatase family protein n=1 Tax=Pseudomonas mucidolens TaxID=46679 RepID=UPI000ABE15DE|nr:alkaline phosphatase family protein [Pseudomonas mucidolens]SQH31883.1 twin-arginine translocation pathway signal [Pseudomonas mucidolens]
MSDEHDDRLRAGGLGDESSSNRFLADAEAGKLPAVTFYNPQGNLNMRAGYVDVASGDRHITRVLKVLQESPQSENRVVIVTVDENGGWWSRLLHVKAQSTIRSTTPPRYCVWLPRVPTGTLGRPQATGCRHG